MDITIALDAMGGDFAPARPVAGAVLAAREYGARLLVVGRVPELEAELRRHDTRHLAIEIVPASEVVGMEESPVTAFRRKKDSSIRIAATLVREGRAHGVVSAGNTGAVMTTVKMICGVLEGVERPALCAVVPNLRGLSVWLDVGANVDCRPEHLVQFALMGHLYAREVIGVANPRVGLMSIGEEDSKGNELTKEAFKALKQAPLNFVGNVEGRDIFAGEIDVIVCDGFTGNVALKLSEGVFEAFTTMLGEELRRTLLASVGSLLAQKAFQQLKRRLDYSEYGGAPLLGLNGIGIVCHGRSNANALKNAIRVANEFCKHHVNDSIEKEFRKLGWTSAEPESGSAASASPADQQGVAG